MDAHFNFQEQGYEAPADWARLWDLLPKISADDSREQKNARAAYEKGGQTKALFLALLRAHGIHPEPYDAEAARVRNAA